MNNPFSPTSSRFFARCAIVVVAMVAAMAEGAAAHAIPERRPKPIAERVLVSSGDSRLVTAPYLAFPAVLDLGNDVLVSFKGGRSHADDPGATLQFFRFDPMTGKRSAPQLLAQLPAQIMQMGEWVRFGNGDIANYIDAQQAADPARLGLRMVRSTDGGRTFGPLERVGVVDGVEYGYAFDAITKGSDTWMLVMTFSNLTGGVSVHPPRPQAGPVDVIHTRDHGKTWTRVRSLTREFGNVPINESAFIPFGNGYLVTTRGYDNRERLHVTDAQFHVLRQSDLTATYPFITSYVGRPRLFARNGALYLMGRNWTKPAPTGSAAPTTPKKGEPALRSAMQLCLFRLDASGLGVESYSILDNTEEKNVTDGYYAVGVFRGDGADMRFHVITYKGLDRQPPSIIQLEYLWTDVR